VNNINDILDATITILLIYESAQYLYMLKVVNNTTRYKKNV